MRHKTIGYTIILTLVLSSLSYGIELKPSVFGAESQKIRYAYTSASFGSEAGTLAMLDVESAKPTAGALKEKSPVKAFALSLAVPGLGQLYYGSKIKPFVFLGIEAAAWVMYVKFHNQGDDLTADFEAYNREHWLRTNYEDKYLLWTYGVTDDDSISAQELSHHLPDTRTQQYYEMTGKYNQFAWGWDDAMLGGNSIDDYSAGNPPPRITGESTTPYSAHRLTYEGMRNDANNKYDDATKMLFVVLANHVISAFEAYLTTKSHNNTVEKTSEEFSRVHVGAKMRSLRTRWDTPFVQLSFKF